MSAGRTITLTHEGEWWVALDEEADTASQGRTRSEALENLDDAIAGSLAALDADTPGPGTDSTLVRDRLGQRP